MICLLYMLRKNLTEHKIPRYTSRCFRSWSLGTSGGGKDVIKTDINSLNKAHIFLILILLVIPGCHTDNVKKNVQNKISNADRKRLGLDAAGQARDTLREVESKLFDIPIPFQAQPLHTEVDSLDKEQIMLTYRIDTTERETIITVYRNEMERFGWQEIATFNGSEIVLVFTKPRRYCVVSLRNEQSKKKYGMQLVVVSGTRNHRGI